MFEEDGAVAGVCDFTRTASGRVMPGSVALRKAFAAAFDRKSGPSGGWRSIETCRNAHKALFHFLKFVSEQETPPQVPQEITAALWNTWRLQMPATAGGREQLRALRTLMPLVAGVPPETLKAVDRRITSVPPSTPPSYSHAEFERIRADAATIFHTALVRIRTNREHLRRWYAGLIPEDSPEWVLGEALHYILTTGDAARRRERTRTLTSRHQRALGGAAPNASWGRLYLARREIFAAAVLLVASEGWNKAPLDKMLIPDHDPAAGDEDFDIHMVEIDKRRRPVRLRYTTNNLLDSGPGSPGRLMGQVIEATELARECLRLQGEPTRRLLVWRRQAARDMFAIGLPKNPGACGQDTVSLRRLRRTVQVLIRKEPAQNTQDTHDDVYVHGDPQLRGEVQDTIAQGLTDAVDHARAIVKMRMVLGDDADELVELSDDPELARAIAAGELDTATASCTDLTNSPHTEPGLPCTASFLLCLACPNAVATRRHLPRLAYLHHTLSDLRAVVDSAVWEQDWREHFQRLDALRQTHVTHADWAAERAKATERDRGLVDRMLARKLEAQ
ncbi:hypothetical protein AB0C69_15880 [Actinomadura sp. NPDC048032]|uniref:hypothetical protein n=1 Tax=Actinomadura sp. NPDC048032 TaxID=3155747 RepID=UPI00340C8DC6